MLGFSCIICSEGFESKDELCSTTCGHIFHFACIQQWQKRSQSCPQCRRCHPQTHKIFITVEDATARDVNDVDLKSQLESSIAHASLLQHQVDESERQNLYLQAQLDEIIESSAVLQPDNKHIGREVKKNDGENPLLQQEIVMPNIASIEVILRKEVKLLEEKLAKVTLKFEKELRNSEGLTVNKIKMQDILEEYTSVSLQAARIEQNNERENANNTESTSVVIRGLPAVSGDGDVAAANYKKILLKLAKVMGIDLSDGDLTRITVLENRNTTLFEKVSLKVTFKTCYWKTRFLAKKDILEHNSETKGLDIHEYKSDDTNTLFYYASSLKLVGYRSVFCKNKLVFVRKNCTSPIIQIQNSEQVDELFNTVQSADAEPINGYYSRSGMI